jgi:hypothetical protein
MTTTSTDVYTAHLASQDVTTLADAHYAGMLLLIDPDSDLLTGPDWSHLTPLVRPGTSTSEQDDVNTAVDELTAELDRRGAEECFECTCYAGRHLAGECSHAG